MYQMYKAFSVVLGIEHHNNVQLWYWVGYSFPGKGIMGEVGSRKVFFAVES